MDRNQEHVNEIIEVCLLAGKLMLRNGAETYRVEDTMNRISRSYGMDEAHSYVTPTAILFAIEGAAAAKLARISARTIRLDKVTEINAISRRISGGELTVHEAYKLLKGLESSGDEYPLWFLTLAAGIASGCFLLMFNGGWGDFLPAALAGGLGYYSLVFVQRYIHIKFFSEFTASALIGAIAGIFITTGFGTHLDKIVIGSVMPLVPGLLITNAVRDLIAGHLISGLAKGAEAALTAFAIGTGIAVVISWIG
jgi:uncharacterized membrane protein YjjP (DUF1212 family)